jgi:hypothetical protein
MFYRKDAVLMAVAGLLAANGYAMADATAPKLSLNPGVITAADEAGDKAPLMWALDKAGAGGTLADLKLNIYGWVESGYTYNHRHTDENSNLGAGKGLIPGPFNHEVGNHYMLNQLDLRFERLVASDKFDVGGLVEVLYGTDANLTHSSGMPFNGADPTTDNSPVDSAPGDRYMANYGFDVLQAYATINLPVGSGLTLTVGKFVTLLGYETIDPRGNGQVGNPFYSHSYIFGSLPFTQTGVLGTYQVNEQWKVIAGVTRGWDQSLEDGGVDGSKCALDGLGQIAYTPNKQWTVLLNWSVGPQNELDTSHYRTVIDPIVVWQVSDQLKLAAEGLYIYDGGLNQTLGTGVTHAYGDVWGAAVYASYMINDMFTLNGRFEKYHTSVDGNLGAVSAPSGGSLNIYSITVGTTITPMPKDPWGKNISIRPEVRYDFTDSSANPPFPAQNRSFKDQLTFAADVIVKF